MLVSTTWTLCWPAKEIDFCVATFYLIKIDRNGFQFSGHFQRNIRKVMIDESWVFLLNSHSHFTQHVLTKTIHNHFIKRIQGRHRWLPPNKKYRSKILLIIFYSAKTIGLRFLLRRWCDATRFIAQYSRILYFLFHSAFLFCAIDLTANEIR